MFKFFSKIKEYFFPKDIHTKKFWRKVLLDYEVEGLYICHCSVIFQKAWDKKRVEIKTLAKEFLENSKEDYGSIYVANIYSAVLFDGSEDRYVHRRVRKDFILWCINKFN